MGSEVHYFHAHFKSVTRVEREKLLCAMIRVNYGTPWSGDLDRLRNFFPKSHHKKLMFGGLTRLIEALSPFADEPTDSGLKLPPEPLEAPTEVGVSSEVTRTLNGILPEENPPLNENTLTLRVSLQRS